MTEAVTHDFAAYAAPGFDVHLVADGDGQRLGAFVKDRGYAFEDFEPTWEKVWPYWLIAEKDDKILGCLGLAYARPIGRLEMLAVAADLPPRQHSKVVMSLLYHGMARLKAYGSEVVGAAIPHDMDEWVRVLLRSGTFLMGESYQMMKRLS